MGSISHGCGRASGEYGCRSRQFDAPRRSPPAQGTRPRRLRGGRVRSSEPSQHRSQELPFGAEVPVAPQTASPPTTALWFGRRGRGPPPRRRPAGSAPHAWSAQRQPREPRLPEGAAASMEGVAARGPVRGSATASGRCGRHQRRCRHPPCSGRGVPPRPRPVAPRSLDGGTPPPGPVPLAAPRQTCGQTPAPTFCHATPWGSTPNRQR
mmetsp:Transcript_6704/g.17277  ORF Transcript_6704/g.17277 Transcript_6704/m.17277 type:complete len:209 (+) Transcript_6704:841-1467(+)